MAQINDSVVEIVHALNKISDGLKNLPDHYDDNHRMFTAINAIAKKLDNINDSLSNLNDILEYVVVELREKNETCSQS